MSLKHYELIQGIVDKEGRLLYAADILDALQDGSILEGYSQNDVDAAYNLIMQCYKNNSSWFVMPE